MNVVSNSFVDRFALKIETHSRSFKVVWVYKTF